MGAKHPFPERLDDYITDENPIRIIDAFVSELDLFKLGFEGASHRSPSYYPATLLELYIYGYLIASSPADAWSAKPSAISSSFG